MARFENLHAGKLTAREMGFRNPGSPNEFQRYATGIVLFADVGVADETVTVGGITYTWKADPSASTSTATTVYVDIGADAAGCATNLMKAINASGTSGTTYSKLGNGSAISGNPYASASIGTVSSAGDAVVVTARKPGAASNAIALTEAGTNTSIKQLDGSTAATTLTGGRDGNDIASLDNYTNISCFHGTVEGMYEHTGTAAPGAVAVITVDKTNGFIYKGVKMYQYNATEQTILVPVPHSKGLSIGGDLANDQIVEINFGIVDGEKHVYRVGRDGDLKLRAKLNLDDVSANASVVVGWRKAEAGQADHNDYDELVAFSVDAGDIKGDYIKNNAATDTDDLGDDWADDETHELTVNVGKDGTCQLLIDGAAPTTAHAGALKFDGNEIITPFIRVVQGAAASAAVWLEELEIGQQAY